MREPENIRAIEQAGADWMGFIFFPQSARYVSHRPEYLPVSYTHLDVYKRQMHANLAKQQRALVLAINDDEAIRAAFELTRLEGIIPALESAHALGALDKMRFKPTDIVVLTVSGRGDKDIETYLKAVSYTHLLSGKQRRLLWRIWRGVYSRNPSPLCGRIAECLFQSIGK